MNACYALIFLPQQRSEDELSMKFSPCSVVAGDLFANMQCVIHSILTCILFKLTTVVGLRHIHPSIRLGRVMLLIRSASIACSDNENVQVSIFPNGLRGMQARRVIDGTGCMMTVPANTALEVTNYKQPSPFPGTVPEDIWRNALWFQRIAFQLLIARNSTAVNNQYSWIGQLPPSFNTPIHWTDDHLSELQYPSLATKIHAQRNEWRSFYDAWQSTTSGNVLYKYDDLEWAMECAHSRAFSGPYEGSTAQQRITLLMFTTALTVCWPLLHLGTLEQSASMAAIATLSIFLRDFVTSKSGVFKRYVLCPGIDMFNHNSSCKSDVSYNYFTDTFELRTTGAGNAGSAAGGTSYSAGEQVFINYGAQSNDRFLQYYGFVEQDNPNDVYDFGVSIVELLLKYADEMHNLQDGVSIPTHPIPEVRLKSIDEMLSHLTLSSSGPGIKKPQKDHVAGTVRYHSRAVTDIQLQLPALRGSIQAHFDSLTVAALRALYCTAQEWVGIFTDNAGVPGDPARQMSCQRPLSAATEETVARALRSLIQLELEKKPTTLLQDLTTLAENSGACERTQLQLLFRIEKKKLLHSALQMRW